MIEVTLGRTGITTNKNGFGALPIQRVTQEYAGMLLRKAYEGGITFFDTARGYSDSEEKIGSAISNLRSSIYLATKTMAKTSRQFWMDLETSLRLLKTDYIDIYQFHNPSFCPKPGDGSGLYEAMLEAKHQGKIRFIGLTNHRIHVAKEAVESGLYDTLQFPFCYLASPQDIELVALCKEKNVGFISMKALSGGLITNSMAAYLWQTQYENVLPIWGIQKEKELDEFLNYLHNPPMMNQGIQELIAKDRQELQGNFCRGCGYCRPCPAGIEINNCARMSQIIRRGPSEPWLDQQGQDMMNKIEDCLNCGQCKSRCPYELDIPVLLKKNLEDYRRILSGEIQP